MSRPRIAYLAAGGRVDLVRGEVVRSGAVVASLTARDLELLAYFLARPGQDVSRDQIADEVLGQAPGVLSRAVDSAVFRLRSRIEVDPTDPVQVVTVQGVGYRWIPAEPVRPPSNVPPPREALIGRDRELDSLWSGSDRCVTLVGPPGIGKTALAQTAAHRWEGAGGAVWVDLAATDGLGRALEAVGQALDLPAEPELEAAIGWALTHRGEVLVVLDDVDRVAAALGALVERWAAVAPDARFLVTSREPLGAGVEAVVPVDVLAADAGRDLFVARARAVRVDYEPDPAELGIIDQLVEALDRIPLAIELAAARVGALPPSRLLERLSERLRLLARPGRDRQATLRAAIEQSWSLLPADEGRLFARLSVFDDAFEAAVAERVCDGAPAGLDDLVRRSLLPRRPGGYRMLASLRAFAAEQLDPAERARVQVRHADWFTRGALALPDEVLGSAGPEVARRIREEGVELRAVVARFVDSEPERVALALICLRPGLLRTNTDPALDELISAMPDRLTHAAPALRFAVQRLVTYALRRLGRYAEAEVSLDRAMEIVRGSLGEREEARCWGDRLALWTVSGRTEEAVGCGDRALALAERVGWTELVSVVLGDRAIALKHLGRVDEARASYERALALAGPRAPQVRALLVGNLAIVDAEQGRPERARQRFEESARLHRELGNRRSAAVTLLNLGQLMDEVGDPEAARAAAVEALDIMLATGSRRLEGVVRANLGGLLVRAGRVAEGLEQLTRALDIATGIGQARDVAVAQAEIGLAAWSDGRTELAARQLRVGADAGPGPRNEAFYRACLGGVLGELGRREEAVAELGRARELAERVGDPGVPAICERLDRIVRGDRNEPPPLPVPAGWQLRFAEARRRSWSERGR